VTGSVGASLAKARMRVTNPGAYCAVAGEKYKQAAVPEKSVANIAMSTGDPMAMK